MLSGKVYPAIPSTSAYVQVRIISQRDETFKTVLQHVAFTNNLFNYSAFLL